MPVNVTVVVPTHNSGTVVEPLVESLLRQTMPRDAFEVLFVDDGSTDDTPHRLAALAAAHENVRLVEIPCSGWPGRPRNIGIEQARGTYVQFADHDDLLGDDALRRMYELGRANGSDIVIGKVVSTFRLRGIPHALMSRTRASCTATTAPLHDSLTIHKMYRTAFLREQDIRFPVGPYVGEDLRFMVPAVLRAASVSVVGDYPCYYYLEREDGGHTTPARLDPVSYAGNLREILDALFAETPPGPTRDTWLRRFWRADMVKYLSEPVFPAYEPERRTALFEALREVAAEYLTEGAYEGLAGLERSRAALVRTGTPEALLELTRRAAGLRADVRLTSARWRRDRLLSRFDARFTTGDDGTPLTLLRRGTRCFLEPSLTDGLTGPVDVTDSLTTFRADVSLRHRDSSVVWLLPREISVSLEPLESPQALESQSQAAGDGAAVRVRPVVHGTVAIDPLRAAGGGPLDDGDWEVHVRLMGPGLDRYGRPADPEGAAASAGCAVLDGRAVTGTAGAGSGGGLTLSVRRTDRAPAPRPPRVTVIVPTAGAAPGAVAATLGSLRAQTLPAGEFEVVSGAEAGPRTSPGGAGVPGTGEYLLYLDPGDRLAPDALERMYAYGIAHDADIVAGRPAAHDRPVPRELFARDRPRATFRHDPLADSLTADKLFHRGFLAEHGLRHPASVPAAARHPGGRPLAEQAFTAEASLRAGRTAVLGGPVCHLYGPRRETAPLPHAHLPGALRAVLETVEGLTEPGATRDRLHRRLLRAEILGRVTGRTYLATNPEERRELFRAVREVVLHGGLSPTAVAALAVPHRVAAGLVADDRPDDLTALVRWETAVTARARLDALAWEADGRLRLGFTAELRSADGLLDVTATSGGAPALLPAGLPEDLTARFAREPLTGGAVPARASVTLVLRERAGGAEHLVPTEGAVRPGGPFGVLGETYLDPAHCAGGGPLGDGAWDLYVRLAALGWTRTARLGPTRAPGVQDRLPSVPHPTRQDRHVTPYPTRPTRDLSLRVAPPGPTVPRTSAAGPGPLRRALRAALRPFRQPR